ncbi:polysaccharide biosynthesis protein [Nodosilinea sp. LEGE 06152]|uniref:polysaccharide biosynthesis protein n=1 Tax=Nodosilinea sp. LEGE 06152 TaxID=2777966 RepID=UPI0018824544|nr:polysaccharide biosynthesis protein [Nodosilinea sp. LEGE 06152]MBE9159501.1 polysaccharide biosynthesis protein [Nodosilinea sp. LEGE 06152]
MPYSNRSPVSEMVPVLDTRSDHTDLISSANQRGAIINAIKQLVPAGSPQPQDDLVLSKLTLLTDQLIQAYQAAGQLQADPFEDVWNRRVYCHKDIVEARLKDATVVVTGGRGCVGSHLIQALEGFKVKKIVVVDVADQGSTPHSAAAPSKQQKVHYTADVRDFDQLDQIFAAEKPDVIFHLAAIRLPYVAEQQVREAITTNIFGTRNVIRLCEKYAVKQCIFSSTGKASRYITGEVYAATKKVCEWLFTQATQHGSTTYGMVRFTHMLDNSSVCEQYNRKVEKGGIVNIHAPDKYICAQNVHEAVSLLLNSLAIAQPQQLEFLVCRNLGWPVETLEIALHKILQSGKRLPIYFQGSPAGYEEGFFRGQVDWDDPTEANMLVNAIEKASSRVDSSGDFIVSPAMPFCPQTFETRLAAVERLLENPETPEANLKTSLAECVLAVARSMYAKAPVELILKVLNWGTDPNYLGLDGMTLDAHRYTIRLMIESLADRRSQSVA